MCMCVSMHKCVAVLWVVGKMYTSVQFILFESVDVSAPLCLCRRRFVALFCISDFKEKALAFKQCFVFSIFLEKCTFFRSESCF